LRIMYGVSTNAENRLMPMPVQFQRTFLTKRPPPVAGAVAIVDCDAIIGQASGELP
jgi:hypothetical protein